MIEVPGILDRTTSRRQLLGLGSFGALASAMNLSRLSAAETPGASPIRSCIMLMLYGGPSHLDTWDMKLGAPSEIRGDYGAIRTKIPGRIVCEHLPGCAGILDKLAVVRSMHHNLLNHNSAVYQVMVGRPSDRDEAVLGASRSHDFPNLGGTLSFFESGAANPNPLTSVALPHVMHNVVDLPGQSAGFLGARHDPFQIVANPNQAGFQVRNLGLPPDVSEGRMDGRRDLLSTLDRGVGAGSVGSGVDSFRERAFELLHDETVQNAFRIDREPARIRERYGRHKLGQSLLLARRLVEGGVRMINVHDGVNNGQDANWDSHQTIFPRHQQLLGPLDQGLPALIVDLEERGLLESTLVVVMGEFGRSPKINKNAGRDHWPNCYSIVLAGGGVEGGATFGSSDSIGAYPASNPVTPGDLAATVFWRFGLDPGREIRDRLDRPFPIADGEPMRALFPGLV